MSLALPLSALLDYLDHERAKWRTWVFEDVSRLDLPYQRDGRFPTIGSVFEHVFLVERRHLSRLQGGPVPEATGCAPGDVEGLFAFAGETRADLRRFVAGLDDAQAAEAVTFAVQTGTFTMTRHKLACHIALHELRHTAQIAFAARLAGHEPPGRHDLFYFDGV